MSKELTEQYKNKELSGWYYVKTKDGSINHWLLFTDTIEFEKDIKEVLAPVPSYEKVKDMSQKIERLEFDNEALEIAHNEGKEINAEIEQYNKDLLQDHTRLVMECDGLLAGKEQLEKKLEIATKALEEYADEENWRTATTIINTDWFEYECSMYNLKNNGFEEAQKALKEIEEVQ